MPEMWLPNRPASRSEATLVCAQAGPLGGDAAMSWYWAVAVFLGPSCLLWGVLAIAACVRSSQKSREGENNG